MILKQTFLGEERGGLIISSFQKRELFVTPKVSILNLIAPLPGQYMNIIWSIKGSSVTAKLEYQYWFNTTII